MKPFYTIILLILAAALVLTGCSSKTQKTSQGLSAFGSTALSASDAGTIQPPQSAQPDYLALAESLVAKKLYDVALVQLKQVKRKPGPRLFDLYGICYRETGAFKKAEANFQAALKIDPENASAYHNSGLLYAMNNLPEKALPAFEKAIALDPAKPDYFNNIGFFLMGQKSWHQAEIWLNKGLTLAPDHPAIANNLAICLGMQHKDEKALTLLAAHHSRADALHNMACIYHMRNQPDEAKRLMMTLFEIQHQKAGLIREESQGLPGDVAHDIYNQKYRQAMKSDGSGLGE